MSEVLRHQSSLASQLPQGGSVYEVWVFSMNWGRWEGQRSLAAAATGYLKAIAQAWENPMKPSAQPYPGPAGAR